MLFSDVRGSIMYVFELRNGYIQTYESQSPSIAKKCEHRHHPPTTLASMDQCIAHEVHAAALPGGVQHFCNEAFTPSWASEMTSLTPLGPRRASLRRNSVQNVSASEGPMSMPSTSRRPSAFTPTAT
jgi:hypothetical protein